MKDLTLRCLDANCNHMLKRHTLAGCQHKLGAKKCGCKKSALAVEHELGIVPELEQATVQNNQNEEINTMSASKSKFTPKKYKGPIEIPSVQKLLAKISKHTSDKPLLAKKLEGQYPNRVARRLASAGLVKSEKREDVGLVFFGKPETVKA